MIDPKLNEIPVEGEGDFANRPESTLTEEEKQRRLKQVQAGYSPNDAIGADARLSDGARGVDVSGVYTGAGAGAGSTSLDPSRPSAASNTEIVGRGRGVGMNYDTDSTSEGSK